MTTEGVNQYWERQLKVVESRMAQSVKVATAEGAKVTTTVTASDATAAAPAEPDELVASRGDPSAEAGEHDAPKTSEPETEAPKPALGVASRDGFALVRPVTLHFADEAGWHGFLGDPSWPPPACIVKSGLVARPGHDSCDASEYLDSAAVLDAKMGVVAEMIRRSRALCAYTGAGLSTAAGIGDYASRGKGTLAKRWEGKPTGLRASRPTAGHRVLAALERAGYLQQWINQNHDGLAQKATFPQAKLNEIHGGWFDDRNPVVKMSGSLRDDLFARLEEWTERADVVLALGTSLSGLHADNVAVECARRAVRAREGGLVVVALQRTKQDARASLRVYAKLDDALEVLAKKLGVRRAMPTLEECGRAARDPAAWYADMYRPGDPTWTRETPAERLRRTNPQAAKRKGKRAA